VDVHTIPPFCLLNPIMFLDPYIGKIIGYLERIKYVDISIKTILDDLEFYNIGKRRLIKIDNK